MTVLDLSITHMEFCRPFSAVSYLGYDWPKESLPPTSSGVAPSLKAWSSSFLSMYDSFFQQPVASGLIGMYSKCNKTLVAKNIFDRIPQLDVGCWNSMIAGLSLNSLDMEAFTLFKQMLGNGVFPSPFTYATAISCCAKLSSSSQGRQVHVH